MTTVLISNRLIDARVQAPTQIIPVGQTVLSIAVDRSAWTVATPGGVFTLTLELSMDGGKTWPREHWRQITTDIKPVRDSRTGLPATDTRLTISLPEPDNLNRAYRVTVDTTKPCTTSVREDSLDRNV